MKVGAIIVAGGKGLRAGGETPKQLQHLGGKQVYEWPVETFLAHPSVSQTVLVVPASDADMYRSENYSDLAITAGGETRTASVRCGLAALDLSAEDVVLIHDAARPGIDGGVISRLISALEKADAAAPALPVMDAIKRQVGGHLEDVSRDHLYRIQTPQTFRYGAVVDALADEHASYVDDLAAIEATGAKVALINGSERLAKITYPGDLERMTQLLVSPATISRIGIGYDVHAFEPGHQVVLCGVPIPYHQSLKGHSDADVAWHALTDAILGAAALGDIGDHFPPSDPQWKNVGSDVFLKHAAESVFDAGYRVENCDLTIICEAPKIGPHRETMRRMTADTLGISISAVSVKATTTEGLGFTGRGEGIAAQAVVVLSDRSAHA